MRGLVIGAGNMGQRHGRILTDLGDHIVYVDLGFDPQTFAAWGAYDYILLCTPPETHNDIFNRLPNLPVFIEKPVCVGPWFVPASQHLPRTAPTMVACNWRYCTCAKPEGALVWSYPSHGNPHYYLDLIHAYDWFCEVYKTEAEADYEEVQKGAIRRLKMLDKTGKLIFCASLVDDSDLRTFYATDPSRIKVLHAPDYYCRMFLMQMRVWRMVVRGDIPSPNPLATAMARTLKLITWKQALKQP